MKTNTNWLNEAFPSGSLISHRILTLSKSKNQIIRHRRILPKRERLGKLGIDITGKDTYPRTRFLIISLNSPICGNHKKIHDWKEGGL